MEAADCSAMTVAWSRRISSSARSNSPVSSWALARTVSVLSRSAARSDACGLEVHAGLDEQLPQLLVLRLALCELFLEGFEIAGRRGQRLELLRQAVDKRPDLGVHPERRRQEGLD